MFKKIRQNSEIFIPLLVASLFFILISFVRKDIYNCFLEKNINDLIINVGLALTGFVLTAYTVFLGFHNQISSKIKRSYILEKIEFRFRFTIYTSVILFLLGIFFIFFNYVWLALIILSFLLLIVLLLFLLIDYLKILFKDITQKPI